MNNRGQFGMILGIMVFIFSLIVAVITFPVIKDILNIAIDADHLDCDNSSISPSVLATCLVVDIVPFFYFGTVLVAGSAYFFISRLGGG